MTDFVAADCGIRQLHARFVDAVWRPDCFPVEEDQLVVLIEAGSIRRRVFHRRSGNTRCSPIEIQLERTDPSVSGIAFPQQQPCPSKQRLVIDDLASLDIPIEKVIRKRSVA